MCWDLCITPWSSLLSLLTEAHQLTGLVFLQQVDNVAESLHPFAGPDLGDCAGPVEEMYVSDGSSALVLPIMLGADCRELRELNTVSRAFHNALRTIPLHVTASTVHHVRSLPLFQHWNTAAVQLDLIACGTPELLIEAACALPERDREKIATVALPGERVADLAAGLRQLEGARHMIIRGNTTHLECLSHIAKHLELTVSLPSRRPGQTQLLVRLLCLQAVESQAQTLQTRCAAWTSEQAKRASHVLVQERLSKLPDLHSLRISGKTDNECRLSSYALAQCPNLRAVELCDNVFVGSPGTFEEALERLEGSSLQVLKIHCRGTWSKVCIQIDTACAPKLCSGGC